MLLGPERVFRLTNVKCRSLWFSSSTIIISLRRFFLLSIAVLIISYLHTNICTLGGRKSIPKGLKHTAWPRAAHCTADLGDPFSIPSPVIPIPIPIPILLLRGTPPTTPHFFVVIFWLVCCCWPVFCKQTEVHMGAR